jgi:hypothetical protein
MKPKLKLLVLSVLLSLTFTTTSNAWSASGVVYCDANHNGQVDNNDTGLPGVLVVITNVSGTYSNASFTTTPEGVFTIGLPTNADSYVEFLHPLTLPSDTTFLVPSNGVYHFTLDGVVTSNFIGDFLISSSVCSNSISSNTNTDCCLAARAAIGGTKLNPLIKIAGTVVPACGCTNGDSGKLDVVDATLKLHFEGFVLDILNCGETTGTNGAHFIDFQGAGTLKGINGSVTNFGVVYFSAEAVDGGCSTASDNFYLRVYDSTGATLYLISADTTNAVDVAPLAITAGTIKIGTDCCENGGDHGNHGNNGNHGNHNNNGNNGNHGNGNNGNHGNGNNGHDDNGKGDDGNGNNGKGGNHGNGQGNNGKDGKHG